MAGFQGDPCWYELGTSDLDAAQRFYADVLGWDVADSGMEGFDYRLARAGGDMVAGMMSLAGQEGNPPPNWLVYFATDHCDEDAAAIAAAGGTVLKAPAVIPGTGRFAVAADPQGAVFGILQPDMSQMSEAEIERMASGKAPFNQSEPGHGHWHELMSTDPEAAFAFYSGLFGWTKSTAMDMGEMGTYQLLAHKGNDFGAVMGLGNAPVPCWLPYFGTTGVEGAIARIEAGGGTKMHGPIEVPGGAFIALATDPQGAWFAVVGPKA